MAFSLYATILLIHMFGAVLWLGAGAFWLAIVRPAVLDAGPAGGAVMRQVLARGGLGKWFGPAAVVTVAAGLFLYVDGGHMSDPFATTASAMLTLGVLGGLVSLALALGINVPVENKMKALANTFPTDGPPSPEQMGEMNTLAEKAFQFSRATVILIAVTFVMMAGRGIVT